jgi:uncharacterized protein YjbI with pentapeptide repeats
LYTTVEASWEDRQMSDPEASLRPANDNLWYCLATLYGEQPEFDVDDDLAEKNRLAWSQWFENIPDDRRVELTREFKRRSLGKSPPEKTSSPNFSNTLFVRKVNFERFEFPSNADFSRSKFSGSAWFSSAVFHGTANFRSATFSGDSNFYKAIFTGGADFNSTVFSGTSVTFGEAHFARSADFKLATFPDISNFSSTVFQGNSNFPDATFLGTALFESATFNRFANFSNATFSRAAGFMSATFSHEADFGSTNFSGDIRFLNAKFAAKTDFSGAEFIAKAPDFRGATMHEATEWHGATWPKPAKLAFDAQQQVYAYERLKQEMERLKKHEDEQNFFRKELRARRGLSRFFSGAWFLNFLYQTTSDYGSSIVRPLLWLLGVFAIGVGIFMRAPVLSPPCGSMSFDLATKISFANIFVFLPDKREIMTPELLSCWSNTARIVSAAQSLSGVVLLFLIVLAIRNRFRMKAS